MKEIEFEHPHRKKHFDFFRQMDQPHFNITANVDITAFLNHQKAKKLPFTASVVYTIARTGNSIPEFRQRIRGDKVVEHERVHPSFTILNEVSDVFSFCGVNYDPVYPDFVAAALKRMEEMRSQPSLEDEEGRDDYLFLSSFPWVSFTSFVHAMHYSPTDSVPRISWGKYFQEGDRIKMPLSVQAHHAVVDGAHTGRFFVKIQEILDQPEQFM